MTLPTRSVRFSTSGSLGNDCDPTTMDVSHAQVRHPSSSSSLQDILETALEAAYEAGRITLSYFQTTRFNVEMKSDLSPVTAADRAAEEHIVALIRSRFPSHGILGEESGEVLGSEAYQWIIDPIDGTRSFICGVPLYGVMIGVVVNGSPSVGVVNMPALGE